jgi:periplasmic protein TonB
MRASSYAASFGLHALMGFIIFWAGLQSESLKKVLPTSTVVKLIRPKAIAAPKSIVTNDKTPGIPKTQPALEIPKPNKSNDKPKDNTVKEPMKEKLPRSTAETPKEFTGPAGTLSLQSSGFEYDFYLALIQSKIEQNFRPPPGGRGQQMATVAFTIKTNGSISDIALIQPSGNLLVDQAAERAIRSAGRFPPLPAQYEKGELGIHFEFVVNPKKGG